MPTSEPIPSPAADESEPTAILEFEATEAAPVRRRPPPRRNAIAAIAAVAACALVVALVAGFVVHRRGRVADGIARATALVRLDTSAAHGEAAELLAPLAEIDPLEAGSLRAFALAMRFLDYGDASAEIEAERLLVTPGRADEVPAFAELALAALAIGRREAGTATIAASHAHGTAWSDVLQARTALLAGSFDAAAESASAAATADPALVAARALEGDAARRAREGRRAREAYAAALAVSPTHPRAAFGLAKLALAGLAPAAEARAALQRVLDDLRTPAPERGRAAIHLGALLLRAGDRAGASEALSAAALDVDARAWAERAMAREAASSRLALPGVPAALRSPSDDG
jgi:tetratricopeptide (TPR) repeat protein